MLRIKQSLGALVGVSILVVLGTILAPSLLQGQGGGNAQPLNVNVINPSSAPVPVRDVDNGMQPFQEERNISVSSGSGGGSDVVVAVPSGKRLVIESVTARVNLAQGDTPALELVVRAGPPHEHEHYILVSFQGQAGDGRVLYVGTHDLRAYADPETNVRVQFGRSNADSPASASVTVSGYFVDVP